MATKLKSNVMLVAIMVTWRANVRIRPSDRTIERATIVANTVIERATVRDRQHNANWSTNVPNEGACDSIEQADRPHRHILSIKHKHKHIDY